MSNIPNSNHPFFPNQPQPGKKACDICGKAMIPGHAYLLSTTQVVRNEFYWRVVRDQVEETTGNATEENVLAQLRASAKDTSAWLVCEECGDAMRGMEGFMRTHPMMLGELPLDELNKGWEAANKWWNSGATSTPVLGAYRPSPSLLGQKDVLVDYPNGLIATRLKLASKAPARTSHAPQVQPQTGGCALVAVLFVVAILAPLVWCLIS